MTPKLLAKKIAGLALTKKAYDVVTMDLRKLTSMTDFFVLCSADSDIQVRAIADAIEEGTRSLGEKVWKTEGYSEGKWILLDYVDVVVHVLHHETRSFYNLEKLWGDASFERIRDTAAKKSPKKKAASRKKSVAK